MILWQKSDRGQAEGGEASHETLLLGAFRYSWTSLTTNCFAPTGMFTVTALKWRSNYAIKSAAESYEATLSDAEKE